MDDPSVTVWADPPRMSVGVPQPSLRSQGDELWVSYRITRSNDHFAVVRFSGLEGWTMGPPGDDRLDTHPLWGLGLEFYAFHEIREPGRVSHGPRRWVVTFHDDTLDVTARDAEVVVRAIQARDADSALCMVLG